MKHVLILEDDSRYRDELKEALYSIDKNLVLIYFDKLEEIQKYILQVAKEKPQVFFKDEKPKIPLMIIKNEIMGSTNVKLFKKIKLMFQTQGLSTEDDPTAIVITAFDDHQFHAAQVESRLINNVIYKPFDKLLLKQHLTFAISGRHPPSEYSIYTLKISSVVEMLKDVPLKAISDIGFITEGDRDLPIGSIAKYYSDQFQIDTTRSLMGVVTHCELIQKGNSENETKDIYRIYLNYFGASNKQIQLLRRKVLGSVHPEPNVKSFNLNSFALPLSKSQKKQKIKIAIIGNPFLDLVNLLSINPNYSDNLDFVSFKDAQTFLYEYLNHVSDQEELNKLLANWEKNKKNLSIPQDITNTNSVKRPEPTQVANHETYQFILIPTQLIHESVVGFWQDLKKVIEKKNAENALYPELKPVYFISYSNKNLNPQDEHAHSQVSQDLFYEPIDKGYFVKKLNLLNSAIQIHSPTPIKLVLTSEEAKVAQPIKFIEVSEAGMTMEYYRPLSIGALREFVLWLPNENENPYFLAANNYTEKKDKSGQLFLNHFVFFGLNEFYLKHLRLWIRHNYIKAKSKGD